MGNGAVFTLWGLGGAVVTGLVLEVVKRVWLKDGESVIKDRWAVVASLAIGAVLSVLVQLAVMFPGFETWLNVAGAGVLAGLTASGLFSLIKPRA